MPDPDTDISAESRLGTDLVLEHEDGAMRDGPDEDDVEAAYDPTGVEASRARELGLGMGQRDLERQRDPVIFDATADDDQLEVFRDDAGPPDED